MIAFAAGIALVAGIGLAIAALVLQRRLRLARANGDALRTALEARVWEDRVRGIDRLEAALREFRRRDHDVNNVLSTALLSTQLFFDASRADPMTPKSIADLDSAADGMVEALQRLKAMIEVGRRAETTTAAQSSLIEPVELLPALHACAARARARHPRTTVVVREPDADAREVRVSVCAGRAGLDRALDAVLLNACEGDGEKRARRVELRFDATREIDVIALEIADDGPGFTRRELGVPISAFESTKPGCLGLGLYTAEGIARASGGSLRRANADGGGALVTFFLPVSPDSAVTELVAELPPDQ